MPQKALSKLFHTGIKDNECLFSDVDNISRQWVEQLAAFANDKGDYTVVKKLCYDGAGPWYEIEERGLTQKVAKSILRQFNTQVKNKRKDYQDMRFGRRTPGQVFGRPDFDNPRP